MKTGLLNFKTKLQLTLWICKTLIQGNEFRNSCLNVDSLDIPFQKIQSFKEHKMFLHPSQKSRIGIVEMSSSSRARAVKTAVICLKKSNTVELRVHVNFFLLRTQVTGYSFLRDIMLYLEHVYYFNQVVCSLTWKHELSEQYYQSQLYSQGPAVQSAGIIFPFSFMSLWSHKHLPAFHEEPCN